MSIPWMYGPKQFEVQGGAFSVIQLNVPQRGELRTINLQVGGGSTGDFVIYCSEEAAREAAANGNGSSLSSSSGSVEIPPSAYEVCRGALTGGKYVNSELQVLYVNRDGTPTNEVKRLWMVLNPAGVDDLVVTLLMAIATVRF